MQAADEHPDVFAAVAVHPTEINGMTDADYEELGELAAHPKVVAIGETGLDYYWDTTEPAAQQEHFRRHIELAKRTGRALMIHDRDAHDDVLRILDEQGAPSGWSSTRSPVTSISRAAAWTPDMSFLSREW